MEPDFLDPITLSLMENAVVTSCGHSFSERSLSQWVTSCQQYSAILTCPVCKADIDERTTPNWALRNAIEKYRKLNDIPSRESSLAADYDSDLLHHLSPLLVLSKCTASSPTTTTTTTTNSETRALLNRDTYSYNGVNYYDNDDDDDDNNEDEESGNGCCTAPAGPHSFACCECGCCGFCTQAAEYEHWVEGCHSAMPCHLPICTCTNWLCSFSFSHRSTWCSRTCCGVAFPLFVVLFVCLAGLDSALVLALALVCCGSKACCPGVNASAGVTKTMRAFNALCEKCYFLTVDF